MARRSERRTWLLLSVAAWVAGAVVRFLAARGDLWYDEILVFDYTRAMGSVRDAVLENHVDNNHALNTIWAYLLGEHRSEVLYRLPSILAGVAGIGLAGSINAAQRSATAADPRSGWRAFGIGAWLFAASYLLIHYDSEARGYAPAIALGMTAAWAGLRAHGWAIGRWTALYGVGTALAILAHPLAVHVLAGGVVWQALELLRHEAGRGERVRRLLIWQGPPLLFATLLYRVHLGRMTILGGPRLEPLTVLGDAADDALGVPGPAAAGLIALVVVVALGVTALIRRPPVRGSEPRRIWAFYATTGVLSPAILFLATADPLVFERYFAVSLAMLLLLLAGALDRVAATRRGEAVAGLVLVLFVLGNVPRTLSLLRLERGDYRGALALMAAESPGSEITIGSEADPSVAPFVAYYGPEVAGPGRSLVFQPQNVRTATPPAWFVIPWHEHRPAPPASIDLGGPTLTLRGLFPYARLSGMNWSVYRLTFPARPPTAP